MRELYEYRTRLIERLIAAASEFRSGCLAVKDAFMPLEEGGWNVHQVAAHTRDVNGLVYGRRARRTAVEDNPEFPGFDGGKYMAEHYSAGEPLPEIVDGLVKDVENLAEMLRDLPPEAWARGSRHAMLGRGITLQTWVEKDLAHLEEHLAALRKVTKV